MPYFYRNFKDKFSGDGAQITSSMVVPKRQKLVQKENQESVFYMFSVL